MARNRRDEKRRLNGFTIPVVGAGVQWEHLDTARPSARRTLTFLADRRVLFNPYWQEEAGHCVASVLEVRRFLTEEIGLLGDDVVLIPHLEAMRAACRRFLDQVSENERQGEALAGLPRVHRRGHPLGRRSWRDASSHRPPSRAHSCSFRARHTGQPPADHPCNAGERRWRSAGS